MSYTRNTHHTQGLAEQIRRAVALHTSGRLVEAEQIYNQVLRVQGDHFDATHLLGVIAMQRGQNELAIERLSKAVALRPDQLPARANFANSLLLANRAEEALHQYEEVLKEDPGLKGVLNNYGNTLQNLERYEDAAVVLGRLA